MVLSPSAARKTLFTSGEDSTKQSPVSELLLPEPRKNARVEFCPGMIVRGRQELGSGESDALFGEPACLGQQAPGFQAPCRCKKVRCLLRTAIDQRGF